MMNRLRTIQYVQQTHYLYNHPRSWDSLLFGYKPLTSCSKLPFDGSKLQGANLPCQYSSCWRWCNPRPGHYVGADEVVEDLGQVHLLRPFPEQYIYQYTSCPL